MTQDQLRSIENHRDRERLGLTGSELDARRARKPRPWTPLCPQPTTAGVVRMCVYLALTVALVIWVGVA